MLEVNPNVLHSAGGVRFGRGRATCFRVTETSAGPKGRIAELERKIGQQALEIDFLKGCFAAHRATADAAGVDWKSAYALKTPTESWIREVAGRAIAHSKTVSVSTMPGFEKRAN